MILGDLIFYYNNPNGQIIRFSGLDEDAMLVFKVSRAFYITSFLGKLILAQFLTKILKSQEFFVLMLGISCSW